MSDWARRLRPASFRGVPFAALDGENVVGRRVALHEYPGRDEPFAEDLGRSARRFGMRGFLVENSRIYGGGDVLGQRGAMELAAEASGPGTLVHPTKGRLSVQVLTCAISERVDLGRAFELRFDFVEAGQRIFPILSVATGGLLGGLLSAVTTAAGGSLPGPVASVLGAAGALGAVGAVQGYAREVQALAGDAGGVFQLVSGATPASLAGPLAALQSASGPQLAGAAQGLVSTLTGATDPASAVRLAEQLLDRLG